MNAPAGFYDRAAVHARHDRIVELRARGWTLKRIARAVGVWSENSVRHHLTNGCACAERRNGTRRDKELMTAAAAVTNKDGMP